MELARKVLVKMTEALLAIWVTESAREMEALLARDRIMVGKVRGFWGTFDKSWGTGMTQPEGGRVVE